MSLSFSSPVPERRAPLVGLFVTCLVDLWRPSVGFAAARLIEAAGCEVVVPRQTCCGQPAFNSGDRATSRALAEQMIRAFETFDYVVVPSGSCAGMIKLHYPELFTGEPDWMIRVERFCAKLWELTQFLTDARALAGVEASYAGTVTYHDSCSGLRELGVRAQPRQLLGAVEGLKLVEMVDSDVCCGFGGAFCVKYPDISGAILDKKVAHVVESGAETLLAGDLGCLLNMAGRLQRLGHAIKVRHVAEVLADQGTDPAIGMPASTRGS